MDYENEIIGDSEAEDNSAVDLLLDIGKDGHKIKDPLPPIDSMHSPAIPTRSDPNKASDKTSTISEFPSSGQHAPSTSHISSFTAPSALPSVEATSSIVASSTANKDQPVKPRPKPRRKIRQPKEADSTVAGPSVSPTSSILQSSVPPTRKPEFIHISSSEDEAIIKKPTKSKPSKRVVPSEGAAHAIAPKKRRVLTFTDSENDDPMRLIPSTNDPPPCPLIDNKGHTGPSTNLLVPPEIARLETARGSTDTPVDPIPPPRPKPTAKKRKSTAQDNLDSAARAESSTAGATRLDRNAEVLIDEPLEPSITTKKKKRKIQDKKSTKASKDSVADPIAVHQSQRSSTRVALARSIQEDGVSPADGEYLDTMQSREEGPTDKLPGTTSEDKAGGEKNKRRKAASRNENPEVDPTVKTNVPANVPQPNMRVVVEIPVKSKRVSKDVSATRKRPPSPTREPPATITRKEAVADSEVDAPKESIPEKPPMPHTKPPHKEPRMQVSEAQVTPAAVKPNENLPRGLPVHRRPNKPLASLLNQSGTPVRAPGLTKSIKIAPLHANRKPLLPKPKEIQKKKMGGDDGDEDEDDNWDEKPSAKIKRLMREFEALEGMESKKADARRQELLDELGRINA